MTRGLANSPTHEFTICILLSAVLVSENIIAAKQIGARSVNDQPILWKITYVCTQILVRWSALRLELIRSEIWIVIWTATCEAVRKTNLGLYRSDEMFVHNREVVRGSKGWNCSSRITQVISLGIEVRIGNPVVYIFESLIVAPKQFNSLGITASCI